MQEKERKSFSGGKMRTQIQFGKMTVYIDNETGRLYAETGDALYELNFGDDVTGEVGHMVSDFEVIKVYYPEDSDGQGEDDASLFDLIDDELSNYDV